MQKDRYYIDVVGRFVDESGAICCSYSSQRALALRDRKYFDSVRDALDYAEKMTDLHPKIIEDWGISIELSLSAAILLEKEREEERIL